jgi:hypothetical protein
MIGLGFGLGLPACGGAYKSSPDDGSGGSGAQAGSAGTGAQAGMGSAGSANGGGGSAGSGTCQQQKVIYQNGDAVPSDDCNTCWCMNGSISCTTIGCLEPGCHINDDFYPTGAFRPDECGGGCYCDGNDQWSCTLNICLTCGEISAGYTKTIADAKKCDPARAGQCSRVISAGLQCSCPTFVSAEYPDLLAQVEYAVAEYSQRQCGGDVACGACLPPSSAYCGADGVCVDVYDE